MLIAVLIKNVLLEFSVILKWKKTLFKMMISKDSIFLLAMIISSSVMRKDNLSISLRLNYHLILGISIRKIMMVFFFTNILGLVKSTFHFNRANKHILNLICMKWYQLSQVIIKIIWFKILFTKKPNISFLNHKHNLKKILPYWIISHY